MKCFINLLLLFGLLSCASNDHSHQDFSRGRYKFSNLFHQEYLKFIRSSILAEGATTYAGPMFDRFNNYQKINVIALQPSNQMTNTIYTAEDGTQHSYTHYTMTESYTEPGHYYFDLGITGEYLGHSSQTKIRVLAKITCKKDLKCEPGTALPSISHDNPFDFEWKIMEEGWITNKKPNLKEFNEFEQMAIIQRQLFVGMSEAAVTLAVGRLDRPAGFFDNIRVENGILKYFTVREDYARNFYNFY